MEELLKIRTIWRSKSTYGSPLFLVKDNNKKLPVIAYQSCSEYEYEMEQHNFATFR